MATRSWIQHPITGKLIPRDEYVRPSMNKSAYVHGDVESFVSPITQEVISDRAQLRRHNAEHGVTDSRDYSKEYVHSRRMKREAEMLGQTHQAKVERRTEINEALKRHGL